jgi:hypothetical protein
VGGKEQGLNGYFDFSVTAHETGHNLGLRHANFWDTGGKSIIGTGTNQEYGNDFDAMGFGGGADRHISAAFKHQLNYLLDSDIYSVTASGSYQIVAHDKENISTMRAGIRVGIAGLSYSDKKYFVDYRQLISNNYLLNGVSLYFQQSSSVQILDTTPGSPLGKADSALTIGRTFTDEINKISITPTGLGGRRLNP